MSVTKWLAAAGLTLSLVGLAGCSTDGTTGDDASTSTAPDDAAATSTAAPDEAAMPTVDLSDIPDPVATVNGEDITKDDFADYYESQYASATTQAQMTGTEVDEEQLQSDTLDLVVDATLLTQAAAEGGFEATDEEVEAFLEELATGNGLPSVEEFLALLEEQGMDEETAREEVATQLAIEAYIEAEADVQEPTDEDARAYYDEVVEQQEEAAGEDGAATTAPGSQIPAFEDVEEQIAGQLLQEAQTEATEELVAQLREDAEIESYL